MAAQKTIMQAEESLALKALIVAMLSAISINPYHVGYLLIAVFVDSFFGVLKAAKIKERLSFKKYSWGIISKLSLLFIPLLLAYFAKTFEIDLSYLVTSFIFLIAANDTVSIISKIGTLRTGINYKNEDFIALAIDSLRNFLINKMQAILNDKSKK